MKFINNLSGCLAAFGLAVVLLGWSGQTHIVRADGLSDVRDGNLAFSNADYDGAIAAYSKAILSGELDIEAMAITFNNRGVVYGELGDFDRAIGDYKEALALKPNDATTLKNLRVAFSRRAHAFENLGETQRAVADLTQALEIDSNHVPSLQKRAAAQQSLGNLDAALDDLERAAALKPVDQEIHAALEALSARVDQQNEADAEIAIAAAKEATAPTVQSGDQSVAEQPEVVVQQESAADAVEQAKVEGTVLFADVDSDKIELFQAIQAVNFRDGPGNEFERVGTVGADAVVQVVGIDKGWMKVIIANGQQGYIYKKWLKPADQN